MIIMIKESVFIRGLVSALSQQYQFIAVKR